MSKKKRLWDKGEELNKEVHQFTVGNDPVYDQEILCSDVIGSAAHARMLTEVGLMSADDLKKIIPCLKDIYNQGLEGKFEIPSELEDCHTAIESYLTEQIGEAGKRIHVGRSRNDQVILAVRLYLRRKVTFLLAELAELAGTSLERAEQLLDVPMPGYTHLQRAMPSSFGMWLHAHAEGCLDLINSGLDLLDQMDRNPLGAAAGFGVSLPLDRECTARLLSFSEVQRSPIDVQNSRGRYELRALRFCSDVAQLLEKYSWDMILFCTEEFNFISLPKEFTTGSSIMPQKRNPDVLELMRASGAKIRGAETELSLVTAKLPSNYHRDFQFTKEPLFRGISHLQLMLSVWNQVISGFAVNEDNSSKAMSDELYATYEAYRLVKDGMPFRDAYKQVADQISNKSLNVKSLKNDFAQIISTTREQIELASNELETQLTEIAGWQTKILAVESTIFHA